LLKISNVKISKLQNFNMKEFTNINDILDFAIGEEEAAVDFYMMLASHSKSQEIRKVFVAYAEEEMGHKAKLIEVKEQGVSVFGTKPVLDLKIADYMVDVKASPDMSYQEALILAMKKEKAAFKLYTALADRMENPAMKEIFYLLAQEESKHKLRFEIEYDDHVLKEN
jgi:rubrerythrin